MGASRRERRRQGSSARRHLDHRSLRLSSAPAARRGLELALRGGARLELAHAHLSLATTLSSTDRPQAGVHLDHAQQILATCAAAGALAELIERFRAVHEAVLTASPTARVEPFQPLSKRERIVLRLLHSDLSLREIAAELFISYNTVKSQTSAIYRKLGVSTRSEAVARARHSSLG